MVAYRDSSLVIPAPLYSERRESSRLLSLAMQVPPPTANCKLSTLACSCYSIAMSWQHDKRVKRHNNRGVWAAIGGGVVIVALGAFGLYQSHFRTNPVVHTAATPVAAIEPQLSVHGKYLFNGTVTWTRGVEQQAGTDASQPFSQLDTFHRQDYDAWTASLECPITSNTLTFREEVDNLVFNCPQRFLPPATKYFGIYDLANNHTYDQNGETGLAETRRNLDAAGAQYFGSYDSSDTNNICDVLSLPVRISDGSHGSLPVAFCGWQYFSRAPEERELAVMDRYAKIMPVFAFVEAGVEYRSQADDRQVDIGHTLIDRGAEFVIINSPHWVQNTEAYKGKLIVYSMGNFIFDQLDQETNRSASIDVAMTINSASDLKSWLKLGPDCASYHDTCLQTAEQQGLHKLQPQYQFGVVAGQNGYRVVTHKADAVTQKAVEQRTNWSQTCQQLGYNQCQ